MANNGSFVPTTYIWDVAHLDEIDVNSPEFRELLVRLYQNINDIALNLNIRDTAYYDIQEFVTGQQIAADPAMAASATDPGQFRAASRKMIVMGTLPNTGTISIAHNITIDANTIFTRIYGTANDTAANTYIPLPFASPTLANNIQVDVDATNVNITTGSNRTNYTRTYIILEWYQN